MAGIGDLLSNKLLLQYMAGVGADIASGNPIGANTNAVTNQAISSQNFMKMLQQILGGGKGVPTGMKFSADDKGVKINVPGEVFKSEEAKNSFGQAVQGANLPGGSGTDWTKPENYNKLRLLNPFQ